MPDNPFITFLSAAGGAGVIIAGLSAWLGNIWANRIIKKLELTSEVDLDLRKRRIEAYKELWALTAILPNWPRAEKVTFEKLEELSKDLKNWYFHKGGMYLSYKTHHDAYSPLQDALKEILKGKEDLMEKIKDGGEVKSQEVDKNNHYEFIRKKCSYLRTCLTEDIESRRERPLNS